MEILSLLIMILKVEREQDFKPNINENGSIYIFKPNI